MPMTHSEVRDLEPDLLGNEVNFSCRAWRAKEDGLQERRTANKDPP